MQIYKVNVSKSILLLLLVFLSVPAEGSNSFVTLNSVTEFLTEVKYRVILLEFKNNLARLLKNANDDAFLIPVRVTPAYLNKITLKFFEPLYNISDSSKTQIQEEISEFIAKIEQTNTDYNKMLYRITIQDIDRDWNQLSSDGRSIIQSTKDLHSVLQSFQNYIVLKENTLSHVISNLQNRSKLTYSASQELVQARKRLEQISTDPNKIMIKHPRSNHALIEIILEEHKNLQINRQELMKNISEYGTVIDGITEVFQSTHKKLEHMTRTIEHFHLEENTAIRRRENFRAEISELSKIIENNKKEIKILRKERDARRNVKEEFVALQQEVAHAKVMSRGDKIADTSFENILQEISDLRFVSYEETKKLLHFPEGMKCFASLQPSASEISSITLTLLQSGMCSRE